MLANSVGPRLRLLRNALSARSIAVSEPFGLPTGSLTVMSLVSGNAGCSQSELADWAGITGPALVGIIDELERRELVTRERSSTDRRRNMLVLTQKGTRTMETMFEKVAQIEEPIRQELGEEDTRKLIEYIDRAVAAMASAGK